MRVVGIVAPFAPRGFSIREKICFIDPMGGKWAQDTSAGCPQQRYATEEQGKVQRQDRVGVVEGFCGFYARDVSIWAKFVLSTIPGYKIRGIAMWLNVVLTPRVAYPAVKVQVRDLVRVVGIVASFAQRGSLFRENSFYRAPGGKWAQETLPPAAVPYRGARQSLGTGPCRDCRKVLWVPGPRGSVFGENLDYRQSRGTRLGGSPCS